MAYILYVTISNCKEVTSSTYRKCESVMEKHCEKCNILVPRDFTHCDKCNKCVLILKIHCNTCNKCLSLNELKVGRKENLLVCGVCLDILISLTRNQNISKS